MRTIGVQWLHEEEGDDDDIQSKDEVINAHNSSVGLVCPAHKQQHKRHVALWLSSCVLAVQASCVCLLCSAYRQVV